MARRKQIPAEAQAAHDAGVVKGQNVGYHAGVTDAYRIIRERMNSIAHRGTPVDMNDLRYLIMEVGELKHKAGSAHIEEAKIALEKGFERIAVEFDD
jgi:hypothetical protein